MGYLLPLILKTRYRDVQKSVIEAREDLARHIAETRRAAEMPPYGDLVIAESAARRALLHLGYAVSAIDDLLAMSREER